ncbi:MAG TPA: ATP-binding protein [Acidimicrobiia bacterium]|nr:ATP-binding protein [Acidimicrobiia bacterium]
MQVLTKRRMVRTGDRLVAGVSLPLARSLHLPRLFVRIGFAVSAVTGFGVLYYLLCWALIPDAQQPTDLARRIGPRDWLDLLAIGAIASGITALIVGAGFGVPVRILAPLVLAVVGIVVAVSAAGGTDDQSSPRASAFDLPAWLPPGAAAAVDVLGTRRGVLVRAIAGSLLVLGGLGVLFGTSESWTAVRGGIIAVIVIACGLALALGPWLWRLGTELVDERRERIRSDERAEVAAHLHDSVLQTLAMVQRRADQPREVVRLARKQERELRTWLLTGERVDGGAPAGTVGAALGAVSAELEETHGVPVEVVQVRDCELDDRIGALLFAAREAISNAQRHSGAASVSVYCEVDPKEVSVFVRDRGKGFERAAIAADRRGIAESIEGRMARHGGRATVRSAPGDGTEVELTMPRTGAAS